MLEFLIMGDDYAYTAAAVLNNRKLPFPIWSNAERKITQLDKRIHERPPFAIRHPIAQKRCP